MQRAGVITSTEVRSPLCDMGAANTRVLEMVSEIMAKNNLDAGTVG